MKLPRHGVAAVLSTTLVLSACSGDDETAPAQDSSPSPTSDTSPVTPRQDVVEGTGEGPVEGTATSSAPADDVATTSAEVIEDTGDTADTDTATATAPAEDGTAVTAAPEGSGVVTLEEADGVVTARFPFIDQVSDGDGADIRDALGSAFAGPAREAAVGADALEGVLVDQFTPATDNPTVLAISRDDGEQPGFIVVQTTPEGAAPELHLLASDSGADGFRVVWSAPMLPGTDLGSFERRSEGSRVLRGDDAGGLAVAPDPLVDRLGNYLEYPDAVDYDVDTNGYAPAVRASGAEQADEVAGQATFALRHYTDAENTHTLYLQDGSAFVFGVMSRRALFDVEPGSFLRPPESFRVLAGDAEINDQANVRAVVFVGVHVPAEEGRPELIAVSEQITQAEGS